MAEEVGIDYVATNLDFSKREHRSPEFLKINPNGKAPAMTDGDFTLFESGAIVTYLGDKTGKLVPEPKTNERATYNQWMLFVMSELEQPLWTIGKSRFALPEEYRVPEIEKTAIYEFSRACQVFDVGLGIE